MNLVEPEMPATTSPKLESGEVLLRASGLRKAFGGQVVLDDIELELKRGEVVLLRGENGSGKTTLLNILTGNLEPDAGEIHYSADDTPRSYHFPRRWWQDLNPWDHFRPEFVAMEGLGRTWQDVRLFRSLSLRDNVAVAEPGHPGENPVIALITPGRAKLRETELNAKADAMLERLGLAGRESSSGDKVSLGQSKRVAIARAVAAGAKVLFLDEPLAGLDREGIRDILSLLESLVREHDLTLVVVEHVFNFAHLHHLVTAHWMLENGLVTIEKTHPIPQESPDDGVPVEVASPSWFTQLAGSLENISNECLPRGATLTRIRRSERWTSESKPILKIKDLIVERGRRTVIGLDSESNGAGLDLTLSAGEVAILQAPNGWGKSTLFDAICGHAPIKTGSIHLNNSAIESKPPWDRARYGLSASPSAAALFPSLRVCEAKRLANDSGTKEETTPPFNNRIISSLSGGEKQRTLLNLALSEKDSKKLVLLDEPFAMMDAIAAQSAIKTLLSICSSASILILTPSTTNFI